jgi:hypothetical protein
MGSVNAQTKMQRIVERFGNRERLKGIAVTDLLGNVIVSTPTYVRTIRSRFRSRSQQSSRNRHRSKSFGSGRQEDLIYSLRSGRQQTVRRAGAHHDASFIGL